MRVMTSSSGPTNDPNTAQLLESLLTRVERLEAATAAAGAADAAQVPQLDAQKYWLIDRLQQGPESRVRRGEVVYGGVVTVPTGEQYLWQRHAGVESLFKNDWTTLDAVIAALGHPVRLTLLKLILQGRTTKAELEASAALGTSGQFYHHLKILQEAGWVRSLERGHYHVPGERVVPLLAMLTAAAG
jgi:DNA-binding transcriptional ArsR family regulator